MKRKNLLISSLLAVGAITIVGCGGSGGGESSGTIDILVHCQYGKAARGLLAEFANEFNAKQNDYNVIIDQEISGDYTSVFKLEKTYLQDPNSDSWGDLVVCYPDHVVDYQVDFRAAANLEKLIKENFTQADMQDFTKAAKDQFSINFPKSGQYVLPFSTSTECMFYNPIVLSLTIPGVNGGNKITKEYIDNLTWDEFFNNFCPKLMDYNATLPDNQKIVNPTGAENYGILGYRDENNLFITLCEQYGYSYTSVDDETAEASIDFNVKEVRDLMKVFNQAKNNHYLITEGSVTGGIGSYFSDTRQCLFYVGSTGGIQYTQTNIGDATWEIECGRIPQASNEVAKQKMISQGGSWCILEHAKNKEKRIKGAFEFYKYMTEVKQCTRWAATTGYYPIRKSVTTQAAWGKLIDEYDEAGEMKEGLDLLTARTAAYCAKYDNVLYTNAVFKGSAVAREQVDALMIKIMTRSVAECTDQWLLEEFNATVNEINKYLG